MKTISNAAFILLLFVICMRPVHAQTSKADSLKAVLYQSASDSSRLKALIQLADFYLESKPDSAKKYLEKGAKYLSVLPLSRMFATYYHLKASCLLNLGEYLPAQKVLLKSIRLDDSLGWKDAFFSDRDMLAVIHSRMGDQQKAIAIAKSLYPLVKELNNPESYVKYFSNLAVFYIFSGKTDTAAFYFQKAYPYTKPGTFHRAAVAVNLAFLNYKMKNFKQTLRYGRKSAAIARKLKINELYLEALTNISNAYYELGEYDSAVFYSNKVIKLAKEKNFKLQLTNGYGNLAMAYEGKKDYKTALYFEKKYAELHDSLFNEKMSKQISELEIKYETEKKDKALLEKQNKIRVKNMELFFVIAGFLLVSIAAAFIYMLYDKRNKAYKALVQKQMDIVACEAGETGIKPETGKKYKTSSLSTERKTEIAAALENAMKKDKVFLQPDLSLGKLAQYLGVNSKYLSQVIHETTGEHVTDFINRYRINEASRLLLDPAYHHISVEGIAEMVGFGSKSTFNAAFKKFTGVTPSFFVHTAKNLSKKDTGKI